MSVCERVFLTLLPYPSLIISFSFTTFKVLFLHIFDSRSSNFLHRKGIR